MSYLPRWNPYRCMRGGADPTANNNFAIAELYNNSTGADLLLVWFISHGHGGNAPPIAVGTEQGHTATTLGTATPLVSGWTPQAGLIYYDNTATAVPADYWLSDNSTPTPLYGVGMPLSVLQPGWSFFIRTMGSSTVDVPLGFIWQAVHPEDLLYRHCPICDGKPRS